MVIGKTFDLEEAIAELFSPSELLASLLFKDDVVLETDPTVLVADFVKVGVRAVVPALNTLELE